MSEFIGYDAMDLARLCSRWRVRELSFFGSLADGTFGESSDVDVLVTFDASAGWSLADLVEMREELVALFRREVDLVEEAALQNPFRRAAILKSKRVVHAA